MIQQQRETTDDSIIENLFYKTIPISECNYQIAPNFLVNSIKKNIIIYSKNFTSKFECNLFFAKSAFPVYYQNNIDNLLSDQVNESFQKKLIDEYPELGTIKNLLAKKKELNFEKLSFENMTQESFFLYSHPDADRSAQRRNDVYYGIKSITNTINEKIANFKFKINVLYVNSINQMNIDKVKNFLCNVTNIQSNKTPPAPIDQNFYENLKNAQFRINLINKKKKTKTVDVNVIAGFSFSQKIANSSTEYIDIKTENIEKMKAIINEIITLKKVTLKYIFYQTYKEIAEKLESKFLENKIKCFEKNLVNVNAILEKVDTLIEIQDKLFSINEMNFVEVSNFIENWVQKPEYKNEIEHQISNASNFNPKMCQLYKQLSTNIEKYIIKKNFSPKIREYSFSKIEKILIEDDINSFQNYLIKHDQININKKTFYCSCLSKKIKLIRMACFYGALNIFKYLQSKNVKYSESELILFAIAGGNIEILHLLNMNEKEEIPKARKFAALYHRNTILDWLIENEIDDTPFLKYASKSNNFYAAKISFNKVFNDFIVENSKMSHFNKIESINKALKNALQFNHESFFCFLLNFPNFDINDINNNLLNTAIKSGNMRSIDLILSFHDYVFKKNIPSQNQKTLLIAIQTGKIEIVNKIFELKEIKQSIERVIDENEELASEIIMSDNREIIQKFISYGNIFQYPLSIENIINQFVSENNIKSIENIVDKEYFSIRKDWSPFPYANTCEMIKYLLDCKSNIDYCDSNGDTCLYNAIKNENLKVVNFLLKNKATIRQKDYELATPEIKEILDAYLYE